jgi:uncharacterized phage-like protein YoqJ
MTLTSLCQARANKKWRENNREKYNAICNESMRIRYINNKDKISLYKRNLRIYKNQCILLRNIDL